MNAPRLKVFAKLLVFLGLPIALVVGLFGAGVHVGVEHRGRLLAFERDVLGLDVEVPPAPPTVEAPAASAGTAAPAGDPGRGASVTPTPAAAPRGRPAEPAPPAEDPAPNPGLPDSPSSATDRRDQAEPAVESNPVAPRVDPLPARLQERWQAPEHVRVKVLVERSLASQDPDWMGDVQGALRRVSEITRAQFGVTLELVAVAQWQGAPTHPRPADLAEQAHEGANVVFGASAAPASEAVQAPDGAFNGAYAVVHIPADAPLPARVGIWLRAFAQLYGAHLVLDPRDPAYHGGSWMVPGTPVGQVSAPWIDPDNREAVLMHKGRRFASDQPSTPPPAAEAAPQ